MSAVIPFDFEGNSIRVIRRNDDPWFVLADVCRSLGLAEHKGSFSHHAAKLDDDEKWSAPREMVSGTPRSNMGVAAKSFFDSAGAETVWAEPSIWMVSEGGLYSIILRCRGAMTPGTLAHRFRRWVTGEVLPALRRTGRYAMPGATDEAPPLDEVQASLARIREVRRTWGVRAAREIWHSLPGLPEIPAHLRGGITERRLTQTLGQPGGSLDGIARWWLERLKAGSPTGTEMEWPEWVSSAELYRSYCAHAQAEGARPAGDAQFGTSLRRLLPSTFQRKKAPAAFREDERRDWGYALPDLESARRHLERLLGYGVDWRDGQLAALPRAEQELDEAARFLSEATELAADAKVPARRLYLAYCSWCADEGDTPMTETAFGRRLIELGEQRLKWGTRYWMGRRLRAGFEEE